MSLRTDLERVAPDHWENERVKIKPLETEADLIYAAHECELTDEQRDLVSPIWFSVGRAYLFRDDFYPCIIYNKSNDRIGYICFGKWLGSDAYTWSYFVDKRQQDKGYGKAAASLAIQILKEASPAIPIKLATEESNIKAQNLYTSLGFEKSNEKDGDDPVYKL